MNAPTTAAMPLAGARAGRFRWQSAVLCGAACSSLMVAAVIDGPKKPVWTDEIFSWMLISDPSLAHMMAALRQAADGGMPLYYLTARVWASAFGNNIESLRVFSAAGFAAGVAVLWVALRRFYGILSTALGVTGTLLASRTLLDQLAEARFYGLMFFCWTCAILACVHVQTGDGGTRKVLWLFVAQTALVYSHVLGGLYSALLCLGLLCDDALHRRLRPRVYAAFLLAWLTLIPWLPVIRRGSDTAKPHGWIPMPALSDLWRLWPMGIGRAQVLLVLLVAGAALLVKLASGLLLRVRMPTTSAGFGSAPLRQRVPILLLGATALLATPTLFIISHLATPLLHERYTIPGVFGWTVAVCDLLAVAGCDAWAGRGRGVNAPLASARVFAAVLGALILWELLIFPVQLARWRAPTAPLNAEVAPVLPAGDLPVVVEGIHPFMQMAFYDAGDQHRFRFVLDERAAAAPDTGDGAVVATNLLRIWQRNGYWPDKLADADAICSWTQFIVLRSPASTWYRYRILENPAFNAVELGRYGFGTLVRVQRRSECGAP